MRYVLPLSVLAAIGIVFALSEFTLSGQTKEGCLDQPRIPNYTFAEMRKIDDCTRELDAVKGRQVTFSSAFDDVRVAVWKGEVDVFAAADRVVELARVNSPVYLKVAAERFPDLSERERVLILMTGVLAVEVKFQRWQALSSQERLEEILCELSVSPEMNPQLDRELSTTLACVPNTPCR